MQDITTYCKNLLGTGRDCSEYAQDLMEKFGNYGATGDIVCLKTRGCVITDLLYVPTNGDLKNCGRYIHHFIFVQDGLVYDIRHNNIGVEFKEYINMLEKVVPSGIRADMTLSSSNMGLPVSRR